MWPQASGVPGPPAPGTSSAPTARENPPSPRFSSGSSARAGAGSARSKPAPAATPNWPILFAPSSAKPAGFARSSSPAPRSPCPGGSSPAWPSPPTFSSPDAKRKTPSPAPFFAPPPGNPSARPSGPWTRSTAPWSGPAAREPWSWWTSSENSWSTRPRSPARTAPISCRRWPPATRCIRSPRPCCRCSARNSGKARIRAGGGGGGGIRTHPTSRLGRLEL